MRIHGPVFALIAALFMPLAGLAQSDSQLMAMQSRDDGRQWAAVGRLNMAGVGFCTATLISETRVLTAAHCLFDRATGARLDDSRLEFLAGWRNGRAEAIRAVARSVIPANFVLREGAEVESVPHDIAVLELARPLRTTAIRPLAVAASVPARGTPVGVVSYGRGRAEAPSIQETCHVLTQRADGVTILSCSIEPGSSGSPVFALDRAGVPMVVSVISAQARSETSSDSRDDQQTVSLGMQLGERLMPLIAQLNQGVARGQTTSGARGAARFLRP